jgi:MHS family proline/betaine transporter-like MFS transporter
MMKAVSTEIPLDSPALDNDEGVAELNRIETLSAKCLSAGAVGNVLEWYDFGLYGFLAPFIAANFFPSSNALASLLGAYGGLAVGFAMRPIGAALFGHIGDRVGRPIVMILSVLVMGIGTTLIGLLPTYREIGVWSPVLLIAVRMFQGLSVGGEGTGSAAYLIETAPPNRRGFAGSFTNLGAGAGYTLSSGVAALTLTLLHHHSALPWIWRLPFLGGGLLACLAWLLRRRIPRAGYEPDRYKDVHSELPLKQAFKEAPRAMALTAAFTWGYGVLNYLSLVFLPAFASKFGRIEADEALTINAAVQLAVLVSVPLFGWISDRFIRRRTLLLGIFAVVALTSFPLFQIAEGGVSAFIVAQGGMILLLTLVYGAEPAMLAEQFSSRYRISGYSVAFNIGLGIGGGTAPLIATLLIGPLGRLAGAGYLMACALLSCGALYLMSDGSREPLR